MDILGKESGIFSTDLVVRSLIRLYVPGYGYSGTPLFLIQDPETYLEHVYHEEELGLDGRFEEIILQLKEGRVAVSPSVAEFWSLSAGDMAATIYHLLGIDSSMMVNDLNGRPIPIAHGGSPVTEVLA